MPTVEMIDMRAGVSGNAQAGDVFARADRGDRRTAGERRADDDAAQPARIFELRGMPVVRRARGVRQLLGDADVSSARPASALPLLRICGAGAVGVPEMRERAYLFSRGRVRRGWRTSCTASFRAARIARLDRDTVTGKRQFEEILQGFREGNFDILVGTQMIAKGHDIPNVTLVGVVSADVGLGMPDFRAAERTFQMLTQVAGRAGRGDLPGIVLMQTINPDHYAIRMAAPQDYQAFYEKELQFRRLMHYPPFTAMANMLVRAEKQEDALRMSAELGQHLTPAPENIEDHGSGGGARAAIEGRVPVSVADQIRRAGKILNELLAPHARFRAGAKMERDGAGDRRGSADADVNAKVKQLRRNLKLLGASSRRGLGLEKRHASGFVGCDRNHRAEAHEIQNFTHARIGSGHHEAAAQCIGYGSINANQEADTGRVDIRDIVKIGQHFAPSAFFDLVGFCAQVVGVQAGGKPPLCAENTDVALVFEIDVHTADSVLWYRTTYMQWTSRSAS